MRDVGELVDGYHRFMAARYPNEARLYRDLAGTGQAPRIMVIACCDSRVDPAAIFDAGPGQLFVVRNVANLVPPYEPHGDYHGTSAALEFAVTSLHVETILVMGHARCGGVQSFLDRLHDRGDATGDQQTGGPRFLDKWMSLLNPARRDALAAAGDTAAGQQSALEHASIRHSITNLMSFPFVKQRHADGLLRLRGGYFDIATGELSALDLASGVFSILNREPG